MRIFIISILLVYFTVIECQTNSSDTLDPHRIVGGRPIPIKEVPFQVALLMDNKFACGGSIINRYWILTAAHCVYDTGDYDKVIVAGTRHFREGGQVRKVGLSVYNSGYNSETHDHDVALLRLEEPLNYGSKVQPVKLASPKAKLPENYFVSGWGVQKEGSLKASRGLKGLHLSAVSRDTCSKKYKPRVKITNNMICAAKPKVDACQGDSGGPLTHDGVQFGVVSFGIGCARAQYPGVYADVRKQIKWIKKVIRKH